jgi:hypothetical protein
MTEKNLQVGDGASLEAWDEEVREEISTDEVDRAMSDYVDKRRDYVEKRFIAKEAKVLVDEAELKIIDYLNRMKKKSWELDGIGKITRTEKNSVKIPRELHDKVAMLNYFKSLGEDTYNSMVGVNSATLNSYFNQQRENDPTFLIPGVGEPTVTEGLQFRRKK